MQTKYYMSCPYCGTRLRRTGVKEREVKAIDDSWLFRIEFECPKCGKLWDYSETSEIIMQVCYSDEADEKTANKRYHTKNTMERMVISLKK